MVKNQKPKKILGEGDMMAINFKRICGQLRAELQAGNVRKDAIEAISNVEKIAWDMVVEQETKGMKQ